MPRSVVVGANPHCHGFQQFSEIHGGKAIMKEKHMHEIF